MIFSERNEFFYASDKEARQFLTEQLGLHISAGVSREALSENDILTTSNLIIINEAAGRVRMEINETIRKP